MSMKVLIADPDWRFTRQATGYLESRAHLVVEETDSPAVAERVARWKPDLVILAAELAGDDLLETIHARDERPAVLLTGWMDRFDHIWRAWQKGGDELLMKPLLSPDDIHLGIVAAMENAAAGTREPLTAEARSA